MPDGLQRPSAHMNVDSRTSSTRASSESAGQQTSHCGNYNLTAREAEILRWVALGKTNSEIGSILGISSFTVKNHVQRILKKLDVSNRTQAVGKTNAFIVYA